MARTMSYTNLNFKINEDILGKINKSLHNTNKTNVVQIIVNGELLVAGSMTFTSLERSGSVVGMVVGCNMEVAVIQETPQNPYEKVPFTGGDIGHG